MRILAAAVLALALVGPLTANAQRSRQPRNTRAAASVKPPSAANRFVTVHEFQKAGRPANTNVSVEGYVVLTRKSGRETASLCLVDSTDKVLNAQDATKAALTGAPCSVPVGSKQKHAWSLTPKGLHRLTMYAQTGKMCVPVHDCPPKVRIQGSVGADRKSLARVTRIEYHDENGEWRELK